MTDLRALAERVAAPFVTGAAGAVAALVAGSVAAGTTDEHSDVDLILFYDAWPAVDDLDAARTTLSPADRVVLGGDAEGEVLLEQFRVDGVACQLVHQTLDAWRTTAAAVLVDLDTSSPTQKALSGLHAGAVLHGENVIASLRAEAGYPEALRAAMVRDHLGVFPLWRLQDSLSRRDAELWQRGELVAGFSKVLGILAGVNSVWFSMFQLKHTRDLVASFSLAPPGLVDRIEAALVAPMPSAAATLEGVVGETLSLVEAALPEVDVSSLRRHVRTG
jgi:hypothetical protein